MKTSTIVFSAMLNMTRVEEGLSQRELSNKTGIHVTKISRYETGEYLPCIETIIKLADALVVSIDYLFGREKLSGSFKVRGPIFGLCPMCDAQGLSRECRPDGYDVCENGHEYLSKDAVTFKRARVKRKV